jgi:hypothetical protein
MFNVYSSRKHYPSARCCSAANIICKGIEVFGTKIFSLNHIVTDSLSALLSNGSVNKPQQKDRFYVVRMEAGSNTSTVTLRVVGGDEKGSLKSETGKYDQESQGTRTREGLRWRGTAAYTKDRPVLSS